MPRKLDPSKVECKRCHKRQHDPKYELCFQCRDEVDAEAARMRLNARAALTGILAGNVLPPGSNPSEWTCLAWDLAERMEEAEHATMDQRREREGW